MLYTKLQVTEVGGGKKVRHKTPHYYIIINLTIAFCCLATPYYSSCLRLVLFAIADPFAVLQCQQTGVALTRMSNMMKNWPAVFSKPITKLKDLR